MNEKRLISKKEIAAIKQRGCCLGEHRLVKEGVYYCSLDGADNPDSQGRHNSGEIGEGMFCMHQRACARCGLYQNSKQNNG